MDVLSQNAQFLKKTGGIKDAQKYYRRAYRKMSDLEDALVLNINFPENVRVAVNKSLDAFKEAKTTFSRLTTLNEAIDRAIPKGGSLVGEFQSIRGIVGPAIGVGAFGIEGAAVGAFGALAYGGIKTQAPLYLQMARGIENVQPFFNKIKTPAGVKNLLKFGTNAVKKSASQARLNVSGLSTLFFGKTINTLNEFEEQLTALPEHEKYTSGQSDLFSMIEQYGGRDNAVNYTAQMANLKRGVVALMPEPSFDIKGNKTYSKPDKEKFLNIVNQGISPFGFVSALHKQTLTQQGFDLFKTAYPGFLSEFNINFLDGLKSGQISQVEGFYYKSWLNSQDTSTSDFIFSDLDRTLSQQVTSPPKRQFRRQAPTQSEIAQGGAG